MAVGNAAALDFGLDFKEVDFKEAVLNAPWRRKHVRVQPEEIVTSNFAADGSAVAAVDVDGAAAAAASAAADAAGADADSEALAAGSVMKRRRAATLHGLRRLGRAGAEGEEDHRRQRQQVDGSDSSSGSDIQYTLKNTFIEIEDSDVDAAALDFDELCAPRRRRAFTDGDVVYGRPFEGNCAGPAAASASESTAADESEEEKAVPLSTCSAGASAARSDGEEDTQVPPSPCMRHTSSPRSSTSPSTTSCTPNVAPHAAAAEGLEGAPGVDNAMMHGVPMMWLPSPFYVQNVLGMPVVLQQPPASGPEEASLPLDAASLVSFAQQCADAAWWVSEAAVAARQWEANLRGAASSSKPKARGGWTAGAGAKGASGKQSAAAGHFGCGGSGSASYTRRAAGGGGDGDELPTTIMLRHIPNHYTRDDLLKLLDEEGFSGSYDFVYLPADFNRRQGLGYAFVNMVSHAEAERVHKHFQGFTSWRVRSNKICEVAWGEPLQGLAAHIERFRNSPIMHQAVPDEFRPALFVDGVRTPFPEPTKRIRAPRVKHRPAGGHSLAATAAAMVAAAEVRGGGPTAPACRCPARERLDARGGPPGATL